MMINRQGCTRQWYEEETVSEAMEALLLALAEECLCADHTAEVGFDRLLLDVHRPKQGAVRKVVAQNSLAG